MIRLLHTADWHLGKKLGPYPRLEEQKAVMKELVGIADQEKVDAILVAGDLYDQFNPSTEATELFYTTLKQLADHGRRPVIVIAGNHDSPDRIQVSDPLARACGIILIGHPQTEVKAFEMENHWKVARSAAGFLEITWEDNRPPLRILHTPFANEYRMKTYLGSENMEEQLRIVLQEHWQSLASEYCDADGVNLLMTHLYVSERDKPLPEEPEGEKPIVIGHAQVIYSDNLPAGIQYAALGHLHRYQKVNGRDYPIVYSSSPLCYSFAEAGQKKYAVIIEAEPGSAVRIKKSLLTSGKPLAREHFNAVDDAVDWLGGHPDTLVELTLSTDKYLKSSDKKRLYDAHDGIVTIIPEIDSEMMDENQAEHQIRLDRSMVELFQDYFNFRHGQTPSDELVDLFREVQSEHNL